MLARAMPRQMFGEILSLIARLRADRFEICFAFTLREEGGYVDDPANPGGATNTGITLATYGKWSDDPHLGDIQVKEMTLKTARAIYRSLY